MEYPCDKCPSYGESDDCICGRLDDWSDEQRRPKLSWNQVVFGEERYSQEELDKIKKDWIEYIDYKYGLDYSEENTCVASSNGQGEYFSFFHISENTAHMYGRKPEDIRKCRVTIIEDHVSITDKYKDPNYDNASKDYFGWIDYTGDDDGKPVIRLIQSNITVFTVQFPGGGEREAKNGNGKIVRVKVELINE